MANGSTSQCHRPEPKDGSMAIALLPLNPLQPFWLLFHSLRPRSKRPSHEYLNRQLSNLSR